MTVTTASTDASATADVQIGENADTKPILSLNVSPNSLDVNETAEITARATQADGTPLGAGQRITLRTSLGSIDPSGGVLTDGGGEATATLLAGDEPGTARVSGFVGASDEATFDVTIGDGRPNLLISANPSIIDVGEVAEITVLARDSDNNPLGAGERVQFFTSLGSIPNAVDTDSNGEARANFEAGTRSGTADVQAVLRNSDPVTVQVTIQDVLSQLNLSANPSTVNRANQTTTVTLTIQALNAENDPVVGALVILDTEVGDLSRATVTTDQRGSATATITVDQQDIQGNFACTDDPQFAECFEVQAQSEGVVTRTFVGIVGAG
ncbi:MAG: invasin domain 3-containing protein [Pseudomonadota bacterium]